MGVMPNKLCLYFSETEWIEVLPGQTRVAGRPPSDVKDLLRLSNYIHDEDILVRISRTHFLITYNAEQFFIEDKSRNGTWIHAHRLPKEQAVPLYAGDEIILKGGNEKQYSIKVEYKAVSAPENIKSTEDLHYSPDFGLRPVQDRLNQLQDILLLGVAGSGKTTLLNKLRTEIQDVGQQLLPEGRFLLFSYFNCLTVEKHKEGERLSEIDFFKELLSAIVELAHDLPSPDLKDQNDLLSSLDAASDASSITELLKLISDITQAIYKHHHKRVVLLIDHLDNLYDQLSTKIFLDLIELKLLAQSTLIYVIALQNEPEQDNEPSRKFLRTINPYWLRPLRDIQIVSILIPYEQSKREFPKIESLGGRHPRLTQLAALYMNQISKIPENTDKLIEQLLMDNDILNHCQEIWQSLRPEEQEALQAVAHHAASIPKELYDRLVNKKVILRDRGKNLEFASSLLGAFIKSLSFNKEKMEEDEANLYPDETIPGVMLNGTPIPLTVLEMGLFSYLYDHSGMPRSYDQISANVWPEGAATNEAISRVVKSLRQKLKEVSPEAVEYIQNVRGVGYKFVQE
jgi:DNA-binding winged helix-turn-helix (wHTH) protein/GTPase SAR1 family protein